MRLLVPLFILLGLTLHPHSVDAADYKVEPIATGLQSVAGSDEAPVILSDGGVLFLVDRQLMRSDGDTPKPVFEATEDSPIPPYSVRAVAFNSMGDFVALCRPSSRQATLVRFRDSKAEVLERRPAISLGLPDINDEGWVAYSVQGSERLTQVMLHNGESHRAVAGSTELSGLAFLPPALNNRKQIAVASYKGVQLIDASGPELKVTLFVDEPELGGIDGLRLTDGGHVVFRVRRPATGLYLATGDSITKLVDTSRTFASLGKPAINNSDQVVFHAIKNDGGESIVVYDKGRLVPIVSSGDRLADSEVTTLRISKQAINDDGQVAFWTLLLDGTEAIYRATPVTE